MPTRVAGRQAKGEEATGESSPVSFFKLVSQFDTLASYYGFFLVSI